MREEEEQGKMRSDMSTGHQPCDFQHVDQSSSPGCRLELCGDRHPQEWLDPGEAVLGLLRAEWKAS